MADVSVDKKALIEGERPIFNASYGKLMMWFFLVSDAFTFSALLITYGALRISNTVEGISWSNPENVFTHAPILYEVFHIDAPLVFVGLMTFILIISSVTMVLAVEAGHRKSKDEVAKWVFYTIIGGATFLGCQAYEWYHFISGTPDGAYMADVSHFDGKTIPGAKDLSVIQLYPVSDGEDSHHYSALKVRSAGLLSTWPEITEEAHIRKVLDKASHYHDGTYVLSEADVIELNLPQLNNAPRSYVAYPVRQADDSIEKTKDKKIIGFRLNNGYPINDEATVNAIVATADTSLIAQNLPSSEKVAQKERMLLNLTDGGANMKANEYGPPDFAGLFFFVTGFHGTHVFSGVVLLVILLLNVIKGTYDRRGHYEMTEKIGLYWHFVDLVWVFVFTFFYLV